MTKRTNYYNDLLVDYSKPELVSNELAMKLLKDAETYLSLRNDTLPEITLEYSLEQVEQENKHWWPTHCEALRQGRGDILAGEYANNLVYFCADGPFYGRTAATNREVNRWAILAQPSVTIAWPIIMFNGEVIYSEWNCFDDETNEVIAKGNETLLRRGHHGSCYLKCEQLSFYRDVSASDELLYWIRR
ncbi:hypothetical protein H6G97_27200 [Nostoc flagelliforme FACHB-838]|uniref:Uncharacterized protein n=1 Tax=Nostoc flagelliforme FACHB-838 TaxID=2692904 RepID=A0ABR8DUD6_9NOSO|nr:hypothetical protein [Nostoc flagelliforme]MBD2533056.1 hypothetical protein [Nostoc flagelliforme FACHB-838]